MFLAGAVSFFNLLASAQIPGGSVSDAAFIKLFGDSPTFSAKVTIQVFSNRVQWLQMPMNFAALDGKLRLDVDMGQMKGPAIAASTIAMNKRIGIDRVSSVVRLDRMTSYMLYPALQSYVTMPSTDQDTNLRGQKLLRTAMGRETIDGHACVKNRSVVKNQRGVTLLQATTWNAKDLQDFPLQIETAEGGKTSMMHFTQVSLARPDANLFELPAGYKQYPSSDDLIVAAMTRAAAKNQKK